MNKYSFNSVHTHIEMIGGKKVEVTEAVTIRNGKGYKTVITRQDGKSKQSKHPLTQQEVSNIKERKFMPTLFDPCYMGLGNCIANSERNDRLVSKGKTRQKKAHVKKSTKKNKRNA